MLKTTLLIATAFCALTLAPARAETVNQRERNQGGRIYQGVQSGQLTPYEAGQVSRQLGHVQRVESRFRQSGNRYSARERCATQAMLERSSQRIYRLKHNNR